MLREGGADARKEGAALILSAVESGIDIRSCIADLAGAFGDPAAGWHALQAVTRAASRIREWSGRDFERLLTALSDSLLAPDFPGSEYDLPVPIDAARGRNADLASIVPGLAAFAERKPDHGVPLLVQLADDGVNIASAIRTLHRIANGTAPGYIREQARRAATAPKRPRS